MDFHIVPLVPFKPYLVHSHILHQITKETGKWHGHVPIEREAVRHGRVGRGPGGRSEAGGRPRPARHRRGQEAAGRRPVRRRGPVPQHLVTAVALRTRRNSCLR